MLYGFKGDGCAGDQVEGELSVVGRGWVKEEWGERERER